MSTTDKTEKVDYVSYARENAPDPNMLRRGTKARRQRRETAKQRITIRLDEDIVERFKALVPEGRGYQRLINQALQEWLTAQGVKELVREEFGEMLKNALSTAMAATTVSLKKSGGNTST